MFASTASVAYRKGATGLLVLPLSVLPGTVPNLAVPHSAVCTSGYHRNTHVQAASEFGYSKPQEKARYKKRAYHKLNCLNLERLAARPL